MKPMFFGLCVFLIFLIYGFILGSIIGNIEVGMIGFGFLGIVFGGVVWAGLSEDLSKEKHAKNMLKRLKGGKNK